MLRTKGRVFFYYKGPQLGVFCWVHSWGSHIFDHALTFFELKIPIY